VNTNILQTPSPQSVQPPPGKKVSSAQASPRVDLSKKFSKESVLRTIPEKGPLQSGGSLTRRSQSPEGNKMLNLCIFLLSRAIVESYEGSHPQKRKKRLVRVVQYLEGVPRSENIAMKETKTSQMRRLHAQQLIEERNRRTNPYYNDEDDYSNADDGSVSSGSVSTGEESRMESVSSNLSAMSSMIEDGNNDLSRYSLINIFCFCSRDLCFRF
jgi:hypothetical protein